MNRKPSEWAAIGALVVAVLCCVCVVLAWTALDALGWVATAPFRWFQGREPAALTLRHVLEEEQEAIFTIGENCAYTYAQGTAIRSNIDPEAGEAFSSELTREEVIAALGAYLQETVFTARDGELVLGSGTPVRFDLLAGDQVSIGFDEQQTTGTTILTRSLDGVVTGNTFTGTLHATESTSAVIGGEGQEESISLNAEVTCPLRWLSNE